MLLEKYGGKNYLKNKSAQLAIEATDYYVEYDVDGSIKRTLKSSEFGKSKYKEDVFPLNHSSVWGSWWNKTLGWGYACCHATT